MPQAPTPLDFKPSTIHTGPHPYFLICASLTLAVWIAEIFVACDHGQIPWPLYEQLGGPLTIAWLLVALLDLIAARLVGLAPHEGTLLGIAGLITLPGSLLVPSFFHG